MKPERITNDVEALLKANHDLVGPDAVTAVTDYLEHGEPEMALEGLCLELMKHKREAVRVNREYLLDLVRRAGLDQEPTFEPEFWHKLDAFL